MAIEFRFNHAKQPLRERRRLHVDVSVMLQHPMLDWMPKQIGQLQAGDVGILRLELQLPGSQRRLERVHLGLPYAALEHAGIGFLQ